MRDKILARAPMHGKLYQNLIKVDKILCFNEKSLI